MHDHTHGRVIRPAAHEGGDAAGNPSPRTGGRPRTGGSLSPYRARVFDPTEGRFLSRDPLGPSSDINLYEYADGLPTVYADSLGMAKETYASCFTKCYEQDQNDRDFCINKCKDLKGPGNCHAFTCDKDGPFAWEVKLQCEKDTEGTVPFVEKATVVPLRKALEGKKCKNQKGTSCDEKKGCVKIWLEKLGEMLERDFPGATARTEAAAKMGNEKAKELLLRLSDCYHPTHSAMIRCDTGKCAYVYGLEKPVVNVVENFEKVVMPNGKGYPGDKAEYWQCPCP